jgi:23S rRNA pseudouridine1911/1915/1917 synthase
LEPSAVLTSPAKKNLVVPSNMDGTRLDVCLTAQLDCSRSRVQGLIRRGAVCVEGVVEKRPGTAVQAGRALEVDLSGVEAAAPRFPPRAFEVLYEDDHVAVIDKPAGMLAHPTGRPRGDSVSELAGLRFGDLPKLQGADRPGVVHRLDAGTSGVMVLARTSEAMRVLMNQFRQRRVAKTYAAVCHGAARFDSGWIEGPIERCAKKPERMEIAAAGEGRDAETYYEVRERLHGFVHVECRPKTGRTHQIRVHLASIELPIVGDPLYKRRGAHKVPLPSAAPPMARQALHARKLTFRHPETDLEMSFESSLAPDIVALLDWLREHLGPAERG